jgi:hypothetical protein
MFERLLAQAHRDHIPPHRIWAFRSGVARLEFPEHLHLMSCTDCRVFYEACLKAENFGEALRLWLSENELGKAG